MKYEIEKSIKALSIKSRAASSADMSLKYSQAALNLAHVLGVLKSNNLLTNESKK